MKMWMLALLVAGCAEGSMRTPEGCQIFLSEGMQAYTDACVAAYHAEKARLEGRNVTTCRTVGSTTTCIDG